MNIQLFSLIVLFFVVYALLGIASRSFLYKKFGSQCVNWRLYYQWIWGYYATLFLILAMLPISYLREGSPDYVLTSIWGIGWGISALIFYFGDKELRHKR